MKNFSWFFGLFALVLGAMMLVVGCAMPAGPEIGSTTDIPAGYTQIYLYNDSTVKIDGFGIKETSLPTGEVFVKGSIPAGWKVRYTTGSTIIPSLPSTTNLGTLYTAPTGDRGAFSINSVGSAKYVLFAVWKDTDDVADWSLAQYSYWTVFANASLSPVVKDPSGNILTHGQSISLNIGQKISVSVNPSAYDQATAYFVSTTGSDPADKSSWSGNGKTFDVTYSGGTVSMFFWEIDGSKGASAFTKVNIYQSSSTTGSVSVQSISLSYSTMNLVVGGSGTLVTTFNPSNATNQNVNFVSSSPSVASVSSSGVVNALMAGTATITATAQDVTNGVKTATCTVIITSSGGSSTTEKYFYISSTWAGQQAKITFENGGGTSDTYTIGPDGKIPVVVSGTPKLSVNIIVDGSWRDAAGNLDSYSQCQSSDWSGDSVLFTSYTNGTFNPTGRTTTWTRR